MGAQMPIDPFDSAQGGPTKSDWMKMIEHVTLTAKVLARKTPHPGDVDDLVGEGLLALVRARETFDPAKDVEFNIYAIRRARSAMMDWIREEVYGPRDRWHGTLPSVIADSELLEDIRIYPRAGAALLAAEMWNAVRAVLDEREWRFVRGQYVDGRSVAEISEEMGIHRTSGAAIRRMAIKKIRSALNGRS